MAYTNRPPESIVERSSFSPVMEYHDRVRWGPILAGLVIALSVQLVLSALGAALGLSTIAGSGAPRTVAGDVSTAVGIWSIISLFIALFAGGWMASRTSGPMNRNTALLNGAILWAVTLTFGSWLLASGVSGAFGVVAANAGEVLSPGGVNVTPPNVTAQQARDIAGNAARVGWSFTFGSLLGLVAALIGSAIGARSHRAMSNQ
ncbi:MAG: hypothetical protein VKJ46_08590 [Leptolyngbyaceae bacterium]|nr:hypothetical protein [Leptolyngbyaceae bacterium]